MKNFVSFFSIFFGFLTFVAAGEARANACFLASESGPSSNCDSGSSIVGLPTYGSQSISKAGTRSLCNNVTSFADEAEAKAYAEANEYDYNNKGYRHNGNCYVLECKYTTRSDCEGSGNPPPKTCCKSLVNDKCWHECNICRTNNINNNYYPYTNKVLEGCAWIGKDGMDRIKSPYYIVDKNQQYQYKIASLRNYAETGTWNEDVWKCDKERLRSISSTCYNIAASNAKVNKGFNQIDTYKRASVCVNGDVVNIPSELPSESPDNNPYGCPKAAIKCNTGNGYYNDENTCMSGNSYSCYVTRSYNGYAESECWHKAETCSKYTYSGYKAGNSSISCGTNGEKQRLKNGQGHDVSAGGEDCYVCVCVNGTTRINSCNQTIYDITSSYFKAQQKCAFMGYTIDAGSGGIPAEYNNCTACPYSARFWSCS